MGAKSARTYRIYEGAELSRLLKMFERAGFVFHEGQIEFLRRSYKYRFFIGGRRLGKSVLLASTILVHLLESIACGQEPRVRLIAPRHDQIKETVRYLEQLCQGLGLHYENRHTDPLDPRFLVEGYRVDLRIGGKQAAHRGGWASLLCIDEARDIDGTVFFEAIRPLLLDVGGQLAIVSTPHGRNWFIQYAESLGLSYRREPFSLDERTPYYSESFGLEPAFLVHAPSWVNPYLSQRDLEQMYQEMSRGAFVIADIFGGDSGSGIGGLRSSVSDSADICGDTA